MNNIPKDSGFVNRYISYPISNVFVPIIYKLGFTPNLVTTITLILRIIVIYNFYYKKNFMLIIILFFISWITDGMDGQLARNYNMKSKFGEIYDVTVDLRRNSKTFGKYFAIRLSEKNCTSVFVPVGFAHGFLTLKK